MTESLFNIPNALSCSRLIFVPVLLALAYQQQEQWFLALLLISLLTDAVDGYLARKLNQTTELGAKLDSWGDLFTYITMVVGLAWLWPDTFSQETWFLYLALLCYLVPLLTGLLKFRVFPSYHTWSAKVAAILMLPAFYVMVLLDESTLFRVVVIFHICVALEEVFITVTLNRNRNNVPTFIHAREIMRRQRARLRERRAQIQRKMSGKKTTDEDMPAK
jgi:phosphatidylglycerophosphate synthase